MKTPKVMVGGLTHGAPRIEYVAGIMRLKDYEMLKPEESRLWHSYVVKGGPYIPRNRNNLTRHFWELEDKPEWLLMADHDIVLPETILEVLVGYGIATGAGVVVPDHIQGTSCPTTGLMNDPLDPRVFRAARRPENGEKAHYVETVTSSVIMVHRRVFEKVAERYGLGYWWFPEYLKGPDGWWGDLGEDFSFSKRARAVGEELLVVYDVEGIEHYKVGRVVAPPKYAAELGGK